jgi:hypothetical protein
MFWLRMLFKDVHVTLSTAPTIWYDNISALALATNPVYHARTKHIEVDYHFIREKVLNQDVIIKFISTDDQIADVFTKGLGSTCFLSLRVKLMMIPSPISLRGAVRENIAVDSGNPPTHNHDTQATADQNLPEPNQISFNTTSVDTSSIR